MTKLQNEATTEAFKEMKNVSIFWNLLEVLHQKEEKRYGSVCKYTDFAQVAVSCE